MKKIYSIIIALVLSIISLFLLNYCVEKQIMKNIDKFYYFNDDIRNSSDYIMKNIITEDSAVILGSSELYSYDNIAYPDYLYNYGYSSFNMILIGRGLNQSLHHTISLGALQNNIKNNKIVLILSPQWFTESHLSSEIFSSRFLFENYIEFIRNKKISKTTKEKVALRVEELLIADSQTKELVDLYESIYLYRDDVNLFSYLKILILDSFNSFKSKLDLAKEIKDVENHVDYDNYVDADKINYDDLLKKAKEVGKLSSTNNIFGIENNYYNTYIIESFDDKKDSSVNSSYSTSKEYEDLKLFINICHELDIEPLIVSIPVHGMWYDHVGFSKEKREEYYNNIRELCEEYNVNLVDFSDKEYEKYFLKDIMHLGWKGWVYLDEEIYEFYNK